MRSKLVEYLGSNCTIISGTANWYQAYQPTRDTQKPFGVIKFGATGISPENIQGAAKNIEIWVYIDPYAYDYTKVGSAVKEVRDLLNGTALTTDGGDRVEFEYNGEGTDYYDEDWVALTRPIYYRSPTLR